MLKLKLQYFGHLMERADLLEKTLMLVWGCRGWGWQAAGTWVLVSHEMVGFPAPIR